MNNSLSNFFLKHDKDGTDKFFLDCLKERRKLKGFVNAINGESEYISLGENCSTAWYLKELGLRKGSYPFDWIFSSPDIIIDCIEDNFTSYLDPTLILSDETQSSAGHLKYHSHMFNHRSPIKTDDDYSYYKRCCERFEKAINSDSNIIFLITLINEPQKRRKWSEGFTQEFSAPGKQDQNSVLPLTDLLLRKHQNSHFLIIDHYTKTERSVSSKSIDNRVHFLSFSAFGNSNGVRYPDPLDDAAYKVILSGLQTNSK